MDRRIITGFTYPNGHKISQTQLESRHGVKYIINYKGHPKGFHLELRSSGQHYLRLELKTYCPDEIDILIPIAKKNVKGAFWVAMSKLCERVFLTTSELAAISRRQDAFIAYISERIRAYERTH